MTASVHTGVRYRRRKSRRFTKLLRKRSIAWWGVLGLAGFFALNLAYQVIRKPGELFAPVSGSLAKTPTSTWQSYGALFEEYSTSIISPELLAALAQVESDGNPVARTYWRWQWSWNPLEIYRPASSALGMFQLTDGTFAEARKYCIRDHKVTTEDSGNNPVSCWFNGLLYSNVAEPCGRIDRRLSAPERGRYSGGSPHNQSQPWTKTKTGCRNSPLRIEKRRDFRRPGLSGDAR